MRVGKLTPRTARVAVSVAAVLATVVIARVGDDHQLVPSVSFLAAALAVVACFDVLSVYLLVGEFRDSGDRRILVMSVAYLWSLLAMTGWALAFPGLIGAHPPLASTPSVSLYLYLCWQTGFPVLLAAAWAPWPEQLSGRATAPARRTAVSRVTGGSTLVVGACLVLTVALVGGHLPVLINGRDTSRMLPVTAPVTLPLAVLAVGFAFVGTRRRTGPETWTAVSALFCLIDLVITYTSHERFSLGWYSGRVMTVLSAGVVLFSMLSGFRRLRSRAEFDAAYDCLTGLPNRRSVLDGLDRSIASSWRDGTTVSVVSVDLDSFKAVNDVHGHAAGDALLTAVGSVLTGAVRASDLVGRVGGEEFLAVLPDTDLAGAGLVAERMREAVGAVRLASAAQAFSASLGVSSLRGGGDTVTALLRRADQALYRAKTTGRDRVVLASPDMDATHESATRPPGGETAPPAVVSGVASAS